MKSSPTVPEDLADADVFVDHLCTIYGQDGARLLLAHMMEDAWLTYWVNPLRPGAMALPGEPVSGALDLRQVPSQSDLTRSAMAQAGQIYIQNVSSWFAVSCLDPQPGEEVLDLAAAPGGKTIAMAARMQNQGRIGAVEPVKARFHRLRANVARCGVRIVDFYRRDGRGVGRAVPERFDRVLLDAPCSSEARMRWSDPESYRHWSGRKVKEAQRKQKGLIRSAYAALKPGGRMVYCTCSFSPHENEAVVAGLLGRTDAQLQPVPSPPANHIPGLTSWRGRAMPDALAQTIRIVPDGVWHGFYVAVLTKPV